MSSAIENINLFNKKPLNSNLSSQFKKMPEVDGFRRSSFLSDIGALAVVRTCFFGGSEVSWLSSNDFASSALMFTLTRMINYPMQWCLDAVNQAWYDDVEGKGPETNAGVVTYIFFKFVVTGALAGMVMKGISTAGNHFGKAFFAKSWEFSNLTTHYAEGLQVIAFKLVFHYALEWVSKGVDYAISRDRSSSLGIDNNIIDNNNNNNNNQ